MKFTQHAVIDAPIDEVNLEEWLFTLSDSDYQAVSKGHRAAGTYVTQGVPGMVNVESVAGALVVQHYLKVRADRVYVEMFSKRSRGYVLHLIPVPLQVRWIMTAAPTAEGTTAFSCTVEMAMPFVVRLFGGLTGMSYFVRKHVEEETLGFAADISRKIAARQSVGA